MPKKKEYRYEYKVVVLIESKNQTEAHNTALSVSSELDDYSKLIWEGMDGVNFEFSRMDKLD